MLTTFTVRGVPHRTDGFAEQKLDTLDRTRERWFVHGVQVREDGPVERVRRNHAVESESWRTKDLDGTGWHRVDGPAVTTYDAFGSVTSREWWLEGEKHRSDDAPAKTTYWSAGRPKVEEFYVEGELHRVGGPAFVTYREDGTGRAEHYYRNDEMHRLDGPAVLHYSTTNPAREPEWWLTGKKYSSREEMFRGLANRPSPRIREALRESPYAPLLDEGHGPLAIAEALRDGVTTPEGIREVIGGAPAEWVRSFEESRT